MSDLAPRRVLTAVLACVAVAAFAQTASARTVHPMVIGGHAYGLALQRASATAKPSHAVQAPPAARGRRWPAKTKTSVACKQLSPRQMRCTMSIKGGAGISGIVAMRVTRGKLVLARGRGRLRRGEATLVMRVLTPISPGSYTVSMLVTRATINAKMVVRLR